LKDSFNIIISVLIVTLFTLCFYIGIRSEEYTSTEVFNTMSPLAEKNDFKAKEVTYTNEKNHTNLSALNQADIIFEYTDIAGKSSYKAIFTKNIPKDIQPTIEVKERTINYIPKFIFTDKKTTSKKYDLVAKSIFINFNNLSSSNFIYNGEYYIHYKDKVKDIDNTTNLPLPLSNIIVQFIDKEACEYSLEKDDGNGIGYIFTVGKGIKIKWDKENTNPIKFTDNSYNPIFFTSGLTWWIFLDKTSTITIN